MSNLLKVFLKPTDDVLEYKNFYFADVYQVIVNDTIIGFCLEDSTSKKVWYQIFIPENIEESIEQIPDTCLGENCAYAHSLSSVYKIAELLFNAKGIYPRTFNKNEEVIVISEEQGSYRAIVELEQIADDEADIIGLYPISKYGECSLPPIWVESKYVYNKTDLKICPRCGNILCIEHSKNIDYPYYCHECDENFYEFEVG